MFRLFLQRKVEKATAALHKVATQPGVWIYGATSGYLIHSYHKGKRESKESIKQTMAEFESVNKARREYERQLLECKPQIN